MGMMDDIIRHEGSIPYQQHTGSYRGGMFYPYKDTKGILTIGYGTNIDKAIPGFFDVGIDEQEARMLAQFDLNKAAEDAKDFAGKGWKGLTQNQRDVLTEMTYQMGRKGMFGFKNMRKAIKSNDIGTAVSEMLDSQWSKKTHQEGQQS